MPMPVVRHPNSYSGPIVPSSKESTLFPPVIRPPSFQQLSAPSLFKVNRSVNLLASSQSSFSGAINSAPVKNQKLT